MTREMAINILRGAVLGTDEQTHEAVFMAIKALKEQERVDAVEVVRCKDCVSCKRFNDVWYLPKSDELLCTLHVETYHTTENDFCAWGERRENADE